MFDLDGKFWGVCDEIIFKGLVVFLCVVCWCVDEVLKSGKSVCEVVCVFGLIERMIWCMKVKDDDG